MGVCNCSMFCCTLLYVHFSIAIILMGKRELIALLNLSSWCLVTYQIMQSCRFICHRVGDKFSILLIYNTYTHHVSYSRYLSNSKIYVTTKFDENKSFDSLAMLKDAINNQLSNK